MNNKESNYIIGTLVIMIIFMSVGFAAASYNQLLEISGNKVVAKSAAWNVHFDTSSYSETTGSVVGTHSLNNTLFTYNVTLSPDEYYSAEFDVINEGTFNAKLASITISPTLTENEKKYLDYYIVYDNQTFTESQLFTNGPVINTGERKHIKVYINYYTNETNASFLPLEDNELTLNVSLNYEQVWYIAERQLL